MKENFLDEQQWRAVILAINKLSGDGKNNCPQECWHYTTLSVLKDILNESLEKVNYFEVNHINTATFWASNIRYLNDEQEFKDGISKLSEYRSSKNKYMDNVYMDNVYLISFCGDGDLLSQWKYYGKQSGIAINFNFDGVKYKYWKEIEKISPSDGFNLPDIVGDKYSFKEWYDKQTHPIKVKYTDEEKKKYFDTLKNMSEINSANSLIDNLFVPFCKHSGFSEEQESRLVFYAHKFAINSSDKIFIVPDIVYNLGKSTVKPALKVHMEVAPEKNLIEQIIVGPGYNQNLVFNALIHMFDRRNYHFFDTDDPIKEDNEPLSWNDFFNNQNDDNNYLVHRVNIETQKGKPKTRLAYKCENGIIIMKSSIPFRGD